MSERYGEANGAIAHLLRATGYGVHPGQVETWAEHGTDRCVEWILGDEGQSMPVSGDGDLAVHSADDCAAGVTQRYYPLAPWWFGRMLRPEARLHEKICLFWHGHFASSQRVAEAEAMVQQHRTIRTHALGNFRAFARDMLADPALLQWLDGDSSVAGSPNENLAREFMELFTLGTDPWQGQPRYTEADVRSGAQVMTGWRVRRTPGCPDRYEAVLDSAEHDDRAVRFLGERSRHLGAEDLAEVICDHPGTADFVARRLYRFFVGADPTDDRAAQLAEGFRSSGLEIRPLVRDILTGREFTATRHGRARWPVVWAAAAHVAIGANDRIGGEDLAADLGQELAAPKLVNGWALDDRWIESGAWARKARWVTHRLRHALTDDRHAEGRQTIGALGGPVEVLGHVGVWDPTPATLEAVVAAWDGARTWSGAVDAERQPYAALEMALLTPEFAMV